MLSYVGAPDPLTDPRVAAATRAAAATASVTPADSARACAALVRDQAVQGGVLDTKNDTSLRAGPGVPLVPPPPQVCVAESARA